MLCVYEQHQVVGQHEAAFERAYRTEWAPRLAETTDARLLWYFNIAHGAGRSYQIITLTAVANGSPITVFVEDIGHKALTSLVAHTDAFVSLHRAEGFGLAIAEAMQLGRPVIATAYSGNLDFMTPENSYLVPYRMVRLREADGVFPAGSEWADPDVDAAAEMMRAIVGDPVAARERAERGAADVAAKFSPLVVAQQIEQRLAALRPRLRESEKARADRTGRVPGQL